MAKKKFPFSLASFPKLPLLLEGSATILTSLFPHPDWPQSRNRTSFTYKIISHLPFHSHCLCSQDSLLPLPPKLVFLPLVWFSSNLSSTLPPGELSQNSTMKLKLKTSLWFFLVFRRNSKPLTRLTSSSRAGASTMSRHVTSSVSKCAPHSYHTDPFPASSQNYSSAHLALRGHSS